MSPCGELEKAERWSWRTVTFAISRSVHVSTTDPPHLSRGRRRCWRRVAIYVLAISPMGRETTAADAGRCVAYYEQVLSPETNCDPCVRNRSIDVARPAGLEPATPALE